MSLVSATGMSAAAIEGTAAPAPEPLAPATVSPCGGSFGAGRNIFRSAKAAMPANTSNNTPRCIQPVESIRAFSRVLGARSLAQERM